MIRVQMLEGIVSKVSAKGCLGHRSKEGLRIIVENGLKCDQGCSIIRGDLEIEQGIGPRGDDPTLRMKGADMIQLNLGRKIIHTLRKLPFRCHRLIDHYGPRETRREDTNRMLIDREGSDGEDRGGSGFGS